MLNFGFPQLDTFFLLFNITDNSREISLKKSVFTTDEPKTNQKSVRSMNLFRNVIRYVTVTASITQGRGSEFLDETGNPRYADNHLIYSVYIAHRRSR
jgi:hypothetical protein